MSYTNRTTQKYRGGINETIPTGNPPASSTEMVQPGPPAVPAEVPVETQSAVPVVPAVPAVPVESPTVPVEGLEQVPDVPIEGPAVPIEGPAVPIEGPVENDYMDMSMPPSENQENNINELEGIESQVDQTNEIEDFREKMADPANQTDYLFLNPNISTEPNKNKSYVRVGILHFTDSVDINVLRDTITSFGSKGVENIIYDKLRNTVLTKVGIILGENRRCYNTTVQIERIDETIFAHVYGTLYEKKE